jgi:hypothetical protein
MNRIKLGILSLLVSLTGFGLFGIVAAHALPLTSVANVSTAASCDALKELGQSGQGCDSKGAGIDHIVGAVVSILSYIIGIAAVVMVILAGFKYTTAAGDSNRISSAKNTLVYALVGLAIAALAQVLVHFVLSTSTNAANAKTTYLPAISRPLDRA